MGEHKIIRRMQVKGFWLAGLFILFSMLFGRWDVFLGVLVGSLLACGDFYILCTVCREVVEAGSSVLFWGVQVFKYLFMAVVLGVLFYSKAINPIATVVGLSLIVLIPFTEFARLKNI